MWAQTWLFLRPVEIWASSFGFFLENCLKFFQNFEKSLPRYTRVSYRYKVMNESQKFTLAPLQLFYYSRIEKLYFIELSRVPDTDWTTFRCIPVMTSKILPLINLPKPSNKTKLAYEPYGKYGASKCHETQFGTFVFRPNLGTLPLKYFVDRWWHPDEEKSFWLWNFLSFWYRFSDDYYSKCSQKYLLKNLFFLDLATTY